MFSSPSVRRLLVAGSLLAILLSARASFAAPVRIGYFDVKRILAEVDDAKSAKSKLEADFKAKQKQLDAQKAEIDQLQSDYQQKAPVMSDSAKQQAQAEIYQKMQAAQKLYVGLQQELAQREQKALSDLITRLEPVVRGIAQADGYSYVFEKNEAGLFYAPTADDLTAELIRRYNVRYPASGVAKSKPRHGKHQ